MDEDIILRSAAERLSQANEEGRFQAVIDLRQVQSVGVIPLLVEAVSDSSYRIREEAVQGICAFPVDDVFPRMEAYLRNNEDADLRNSSIEVLTRLGRKVTPQLERLLKDYDEEVRIFSIGILGSVQDPETVDALINALADPDENVRHIAAESLGKIRAARAVDALIQCLDQEFWIQYPAVVALGEIGDARAIDSLVKLSNDEMLKQAVVEALGKIGDISVVPFLANILSTNDPSIRNTTINALVTIQSRIEKHFSPNGNCLPSIKKSLENGDLVEHLLQSLQDQDPEVKKNSIITLGWLREPRSVKCLMGMLNEYDLEEYVVGSLVCIGDQALPQLIKGLDNPDPKVKGSLIRCLGWIGNTDAIKTCLPFLKDRNPELRYQTLMAVNAAMDDLEIEDAMLDLLSESNPEVRSTLIEFLGKSQSKTLPNKLLDRLAGPEENVQITCLKVLARLKHETAVPLVKSLFSSARDEIRTNAYQALVAISQKKFDPEILALGISDPSPAIRKASAKYLSFSEEKQNESLVIPLLRDDDPEVRLEAIQAVGKTASAKVIQELTSAFRMGDKQIRLAIIKTMGQIQSKTSSQFLLECLKQSDPDLKRAAAESLGQLQDLRAIPELIVILEDPDWGVRISAVQALAQIGDKRCLNHLLDKLEDKEDLVKKEIILALGKLEARESVNFILPLIFNENLQLEILGTLEKLGIPDLNFFLEFIKRCNTRVKGILVELLGRLKNPAALEYLAESLENDFFTVRAHAAKALGEIGGPGAIPILLRVLKEDPSEEVKREAALALKKLDARK